VARTLRKRQRLRAQHGYHAHVVPKFMGLDGFGLGARDGACYHFPIPTVRGEESFDVLIPMPIAAIHPGEHLAEELKALERSAAELARKMNAPTNRITQILNGTRSITGDTALRLAHFFGTSAQFWLNLQSLYDLRLAEEKAGKSIKALPRLKRREPVPV
jgi:addiction module HigA family antidote